MPQNLPLLALNFDYYPAYSGELLNSRYEVLRNAGGGAHSSVWFVQDTKFDKNGSGDAGKRAGCEYLAVKILTAEMTRRHTAGQCREQQLMERIQAQGEHTWGLPVLCDCFHTTSPFGSHLCLVMHILGGSISDLRKAAPGKALPVHLVKTIITQLVKAVAQLHELGIIHTDIKPANILVNSVRSDRDFEKYLEQNPPKYDGYFQLPIRDESELPNFNSLSLDEAGERKTFVEHRHLVVQPLPLPLTWDSSPKDAELISITLVDFGKAQAAGEQPTVEEFAPLGLRSPEEILHSYFGPKIDIWAIGCLTFEFLTGRWLFHPEEGETWTLDDDHLAKMLELTGEQFNDTMLNFSLRKEDFFDDDFNLKNIPDLIPLSIDEAISVYEKVPESEVGPAADFIRTCLRLDPLQRPSAKDLEQHPWLKNGFSC